VTRFHAALEGPGPRFIFEMKRASPSAGELRADYDPGAIAREYRGIADAISVLTAAPRFGGALADLRAARRHAAQPILRKDFLTDPGQMIEAREHGADAVLLILAMLDDAAYRRCSAAARSLGMDVLAEVHDETDLDRALALEARIIGINNRDLRSLAVDLATTERLAPLIPRDRLIVAESGIRDRADVARLAPHVDAFLIGTSVMRAASPGIAARELVHGRVKICGLTTPEDARLAWEAGASLGGVVLAPSPRRIDEARAKAIAVAVPLPLVGVFVNETPAEVAGIATRLGLTAVQLHGEEPDADVAALRGMLPAGCEIWKAVRMREGSEVPRMNGGSVDRVLLDAWGPEQRGGTGATFTWRGLSEHPDRARFVLAGGITAANARAAGRTGCGILDVSSGVESRPGVKDAGRLRQLFSTLREALR
jgi:indole-3-glycerol phosphate synthase/phosphoribosylanthranilate isomerase